ncbi:MAG TPA: autotransporter-associated beta strand repeat-containing protein, partial [Gemmataceae bacterium]|nr:autotransporter-associated beta strand repeat-containing protein [Gemmataceae bacterium]
MFGLSWIRKVMRRFGVVRRQANRQERRRSYRLGFEFLESRLAPATLAGTTTLTYTAGSGINNNLSVTISGSNFVFTDSAETITTSISGATGSGTNTVNVPTASVTGITLNLGDGNDVVSATGVVLAAQTLNISHTGSGLTIGGPLTTTTTAITVSNTGTGNLTVNGAITSTSGAVSLSSANNLALAANVNAGSGAIALTANSDGSGSDGLSQTGGTITTTNTTATAVAITVNTTGGGTGNASIDSITATTGTLAVSTFRGGIVYAGTNTLDSFQTGQKGNGGTAPTRLISAKTYTFTTSNTGGATGGVGTEARPLQLNSPASATASATAGDGGVYLVDWGTVGSATLTLSGASATNTGNILVTVANANGHNLTVSGPVNTGSGYILLAADDNFVLSGAVGGASFSGTVYIAGNRDTGNTGTLNMGTGSITTSSTSASAVILEDFGGVSGTVAGTLTLGNITVGNGGTITATTVPTSGLHNSVQSTSQGQIVANSASVVLNAGADGTVKLTAQATTGSTDTNGIGTSAIPIKITAGNISATNTSSKDVATDSIYITATTATKLTATVAGNVAGTLNVTATNGAITVVSAKTAGGGAINLTSASGIIVSGTLGSATTGSINISGPLAGTGTITAGSGTTLTVTQDPDSTFDGAIQGSQNFTKAGAGTLKLTSSSSFSGSTTVSGGSLLDDGSLSATSGATVSSNGTLTGTGSINGSVVVSGTISPGDPDGTTILSTGNLTFASGGQFAVDLNSTTVSSGYDQLKVTGTIDLTNATLVVNAASGFSVGDSFTIIQNVSGGTVGGSFTNGASFAASGYIFSVDTSDANHDVILTVTAIVPLIIDVTNNHVIYSSATGINSSLTVTNTSNTYTFTDAAGNIALTNNAIAAGWIITNGVASGPSSSITDVILNFSDGDDTLAGLDAGSANVSISGSGTLDVTGTAGTSGTFAISNFTGVTDDGSISGANGVSITSSDALSLDGGGSVASSGGNVLVNPGDDLTIGGALTMSSGASNGTVTFSSTLANDITVGSLTVSSGSLKINTAATLTLNGIISAAGSATISGVATVASSGTQSLGASTLSINATNAIGTSSNNIGTQAATITASGGSGGVYLKQNGTSSVTVSAAAGANVSVLDQSGDLTIPTAISTTNGNITLASAGALNLNANLNAGSGTIALSANTAGTGTGSFNQAAAVTITTTNTTSSALSITVNTSSGGTGNANLGVISVGSNSGGTITVNSNGGSILNTDTTAFDDSQLGIANGGNAPTQVIKAANYVFTASGSGAIGTNTVPIQATNFGTDGVAGGSNFTLNAGDGGVYLTDWGGTDLTLAGASATGSGNIRVASANATGHNLWITGSVSAVSGNIYLVSDDNIDVSGSNTIIGGTGFSGTVWMQANRDQTTAGQTLTMSATSSIVTTNTTSSNVAPASRTPTTQAVYLDISGDQGTPAILTVGSIKTGDGGMIVLEGIPHGIAAEAGKVVQAAGAVFDAGATGTVLFDVGITATAVADAIGASANPISVSAGNVVVNSNWGNVYITDAIDGGFTTAITNAVSGQTGTGPSLNLASTAKLTIAADTANINNGVINLTGTTGVALNGNLGSSNTGAISVTGPLSGNSNIVMGTGNVTVTQNADSSYAGNITGSSNLIKAGTGALSLTGASTYSGTTQVNAGALLVDGSITSSATIGANGTLGGAGTAASVTAGGAVSPGDPVSSNGKLTSGATDLSNGGNLVIGITGFATAGTDYDQLVTGSNALTLCGTSTLTLDLSGLAASGTALHVISGTNISGTFANVNVVNNPLNLLPMVSYNTDGVDITLLGNATHFQVTASPTSVTAGGTTTVTVTALDAFGSVATIYTGTVHLTSSDTQAGLPADATLINGVGTFTVTLKTAGNQTVTATDTADSSITGTSGTITVTAAAVDHFAFSGTPSTTTAGNSFDFQIDALDAYGNAVTDFNGSADLASTDSGTSSVLPATASFTNGVADVTAILTIAGSQSISASDGTHSGTSNSITVTAATADHFAVTDLPASITAGSSFSFTVTAQDVYGNTAAAFAGSVDFSSSDTNAAVQLPASGSLTNGVGSFTATLVTAGSQ